VSEKEKISVVLGMITLAANTFKKCHAASKVEFCPVTSFDQS
jgi:hypothetical protein